jgi:hypothetical protein
MADRYRIRSAHSSRLFLLNATQTILLENGEEIFRHSSLADGSNFNPEEEELASQNASSWSFCVEGSTGKNYDVYLDSMIANCSCPDCAFRHKLCKHIYFVIERVAQLPELVNNMDHDDVFQGLLTPELNQKLVNRIFRRQKKPNEEEEGAAQKIEAEEPCPICFETEFVVTNTTSCPCCNKSMHMSCMRMWWQRRKTTCPLCRGPFRPPRRLGRTQAEEEDQCLSKLE